MMLCYQVSRPSREDIEDLKKGPNVSIVSLFKQNPRTEACGSVFFNFRHFRRSEAKV